MKYQVVFSRAADEDLQRLFDFALQRALESNSSDLDLPERALEAIKHGIVVLSTSPFACRKAGDSPFVRELVIPFGSSGYVALFEVVDDKQVIIGAIRHQREDDYH